MAELNNSAIVSRIMRQGMGAFHAAHASRLEGAQWPFLGIMAELNNSAILSRIMRQDTSVFRASYTCLSVRPNRTPAQVCDFPCHHGSGGRVKHVSTCWDGIMVQEDGAFHARYTSPLERAQRPFLGMMAELNNSAIVSRIIGQGAGVFHAPAPVCRSGRIAHLRRCGIRPAVRESASRPTVRQSTGSNPDRQIRALLDSQRVTRRLSQWPLTPTTN